MDRVTWDVVRCMCLTQFVGFVHISSIREICVIIARNNMERDPITISFDTPFYTVLFLRNLCVVFGVCVIAPPFCAFLERVEN